MAPRKTYILKLYVAGNTANSMRALKTLRNILDTEFQGVYALKVIDVLQNPQLAEEDKILATPTLAKILPPPVRRIIGDLSDREKVLIGLDLLYDELSEEDFGSDDDLDSSGLISADLGTDGIVHLHRHAHDPSPSANQFPVGAGQPGSPDRSSPDMPPLGPGPGGGSLESPLALPPLESL
jgi:circadian clock protein KaiB